MVGGRPRTPVPGPAQRGRALAGLVREKLLGTGNASPALTFRMRRIATAATGLMALLMATVARPDAARDGLDDPAFAMQGSRVLTAVPSPAQPFGVPAIADVAADAQGRIYLLTGSTNPEAAVPTVLRLDRRGRLDAAYGVDGRAVVPTVGAFGSGSLVPALAVDRDGNAFVAAVRRREDGNSCTALHRLNADGSHDESFRPFPPDRCTDFGNPWSGELPFWFVRLGLHQGRLLMTGPTRADGGSPGTGLARLEVDGRPVAGFGVGGLLRPGEWGGGVALDGNRTIGLGVGCLRALDPAGLPEPGFGKGGCSPIAPQDPQISPLDLGRDSSNRIVMLATGLPVAGQPTACRGCLSRRAASGALDADFNPGGLSPGPPGWVYLWPLAAGGAPVNAVPRAIVPRPGARLAAFADLDVVPAGRKGQIVALTPEGAPDLRFGPLSTPGRLDLLVDGAPAQLGIVAAATPAGLVVVLSPLEGSGFIERHIVRHLIDDGVLSAGFE